MKASDLRRGRVYTYTGSSDKVEVMYTGTTFDPGFGWGYGFRGYSEESGEYDGYFNILSAKTVEDQVDEV